MESDYAARASIALYVLKDIVGIKAPTVVARYEIPHHQFVVTLKGMVLPVAQPTMRWAEKVRMNQSICLMHIGYVVLGSYSKSV